MVGVTGGGAVVAAAVVTATTAGPAGGRVAIDSIYSSKPLVGLIVL